MFACLLARASGDAVLLGAGDDVFGIESVWTRLAGEAAHDSFAQLIRRLRSFVRAPSENPIDHAHERFLPRRAPPLYLMPA